jgi:hypothetical protein
VTPGSWVLCSLLLGANTVRIDVDPDERCASASAVRLALARSSAELDGRFTLTLERVDAQAVRVSLRRQGALLGTRTLSLGAGDCAEFPKTVAYLARAWAGESLALPPRPVGAAAPPVAPPASPAEVPTDAAPAAPAPAMSAAPPPAAEVVAPPAPAPVPLREERAASLALWLGGAELAPSTLPVATGAIHLAREWGTWALGLEGRAETPRQHALSPGIVSTWSWTAGVFGRGRLWSTSTGSLDAWTGASVEQVRASASGYTTDRRAQLWGASVWATVTVGWSLTRHVRLLAFVRLDVRPKAESFDVGGAGTAVVLPVWSGSAGGGCGWDFF